MQTDLGDVGLPPHADLDLTFLGCAWYQGCRPSGSVFGSIQRGSLSMTANSGDFQSMSVYGLKLRRTDPSDSVFSISTYLASSWTSMLRRQRRTNLVRACFWRFLPEPFQASPMRFTFGRAMSNTVPQVSGTY